MRPWPTAPRNLRHSYVNFGRGAFDHGRFKPQGKGNHPRNAHGQPPARPSDRDLKLPIPGPCLPDRPKLPQRETRGQRGSESRRDFVFAVARRRRSRSAPREAKRGVGAVGSLTPSMHSLTMTLFNEATPRDRIHEAHVSAEQPEEEEGAWFPRPDAQQRRTACPVPAPPEGAEAPHGLTAAGKRSGGSLGAVGSPRGASSSRSTNGVAVPARQCSSCSACPIRGRRAASASR